MQTATVRHILPKANQIVDTAQANFKSAYPFQLKKMKHFSHLGDPQPASTFQYNKDTYVNTFKPMKKNVKEHFAQKHLVYDKFNNNFDEEIFNVNIFSIQRLKNLRNNDFILNLDETPSYECKDEDNPLVFDSRFECGNLSLVSRIQNNFFLLLHNDVNTSGYTNWFYFSVEPKKLGKYRLAIMNYGKAGWAYGLGTGICYRQDGEWKRGGQHIFCQSNSKLFGDNDPFRGFNTLSFEFQFKNFEKVYFSYNVPYSYTDLLTTLDEIERQNYNYYHRKLAGTSICGNRIEMLTIGNFQKHKSAQSAQQIPVIVLLARSHPGETVSSWVLHFFLNFILSNQLEARILRDKFIFKIFPMINPDGVIHGNYRCSLIGRDLNRRWNKAIKQLYPEVYYVKNQILELSEKKIIKLVVDLHGHTQKRQAFFYGCNDKNQPHKCRLFPYLLSKISQSFDFGSANFNIDRSKLSTARITLFMLLKSCDVFTLQTSQFGLRNQVFYKSLFQQMGESLGKGIFFYFKLNKILHVYIKNDQKQQNSGSQMKKLISNQKTGQQIEHSTRQLLQPLEILTFENCMLDADKLERQILQNNNILKFGNDKDDGSDSEPSVCNINFDNLNKMCNRKDLRINSYAKTETKRNVNRVLVTNKRLQLNKKSIDLLPIGNNKMLPVPQRFASTSHSFRKNSQDSSDHSHLARTMSKFPGKKGSSERGISTPSINGRNLKNGNAQQIVKMINFELSFDGFTSQREGTKRKFRSTNNDILNKILDVRVNSFVNYTQPALTRPYSFLYKNKRSKESRK